MKEREVIPTAPATSGVITKVLLVVLSVAPSALRLWAARKHAAMPRSDK